MTSVFLQNFPPSTAASTTAVLTNFIDMNSTAFKFDDLSSTEKEDLWKNFIAAMKGFEQKDVQIKCLSCIRIICRDPAIVDNPGFSYELLEVISSRTNATPEDSDKIEVAIEAVKSLCNILRNGPSAVDKFLAFGGMKYILNRLECSGSSFPLELTMFDVKLLFLISALNVPFRKEMAFELNGMQILVNILKETLNSNSLSHLKTMELVFISDILKTQFNFLSAYVENNPEVGDIQATLISMGQILSNILITPCRSQDSVLHKLKMDVINLLTLYPSDCCLSIIAYRSSNGLCFNSNEPAKVVVDILESILDENESKKVFNTESLMAVLMALLNLSKSQSAFRKYYRKLVLPHLTDIYRRPEEGNTLRNKLCRLLTCPFSSVSDLAASWLFVLCKEKVSRMVKYTGYGNAAGLFARQGMPTSLPDYSSDSEDSDTEEYLLNKEEINPVVGCRMSPVPEPAMTEEQKEYFAMELVNSIDKLQRQGIIQPCSIGEDGKPIPIDHVLQLQSDLPKNKVLDKE